VAAVAALEYDEVGTASSGNAYVGDFDSPLYSSYSDPSGSAYSACDGGPPSSTSAYRALVNVVEQLAGPAYPAIVKFAVGSE